MEASDLLKIREDRVRRALRQRGLALWKVQPKNQWFPTHGPYAVVNSTSSFDTRVERYGLELDQLEADYLRRK